MKLHTTASMLALMIGVSAAHAQSAPTPRAAGDTVNAADIIVTANKRAENLQTVPVAVTPVSEQQLKSLNIVSVTDLSQVAPSLNFVGAASPQSSQFVIRGVGTFAFNDALEQSVGVVVDGIPQARLVGSIADAVDLARIQVLRGPQGTLFGKNATAGVIAIDYQNAILDKQEVVGRIFYGSYNEARGALTANLPFGQDFAARLTGFYGRRDGYIDAPHQSDGNIGSFVDRGVRLKLAARPIPNWRIDLTGEYTRDWNDGSIQTARAYLPVARDLIIQQIDLSEGVVAGPGNLKSAKEYPENGVIEQERGVANSVLTFGNVDWTTILGYNHTYSNNIFDYDFTDSTTFAQGSVTHYISDLNQFTAETRLSNAAKGRFNYVAGFFYYKFDETAHQNATNLLTTAAPSTLTSFDQLIGVHTHTYAFFGDINYKIGKFTLMAGGRYSNETSSGSYDRTASKEFPRPNVLFGVLDVVNTPTTYKDFSWRFGLQYHPTDDIMLYGTASRAYKGRGFNYTLNISAAQFALNQGIIKEEIAKSYEIGLRSQWFDKQLTFNLTGYISPFTNFQVTSVLPTVPPSFATVNAPKLLAKGVELEFAVRPRQSPFSIDGNIVYNDTHYSDFSQAPCYVGQPVAAAPTTAVGVCAPVSTTSTLQVQNVDGLRAVGAPEWQANITGHYDTRLTETLKGFALVNINYNSSQQYSVGNPTSTIQPAYTVVNLTLGVARPNDRWRLSFYVRNLTDKRYTTRIVQSNPTTTQTIPFNALRSFGGSLDFRF